MQSQLIQYIRQNGVMVGAVAAVKIDEGRYNIGISVCRSKNEPRFIKARARDIAVNRAMVGAEIVVPNRMEKRIIDNDVVEINVVQDCVNRMKVRANKYFKVPAWNEQLQS